MNEHLELAQRAFASEETSRAEEAKVEDLRAKGGKRSRITQNAEHN